MYQSIWSPRRHDRIRFHPPLAARIARPVAYLYPLMLDLTDRRIIIMAVGRSRLGKAAALNRRWAQRKSAQLQFNFTECFHRESNVPFRPYQPGDLNDADLVLCRNGFTGGQ